MELHGKNIVITGGSGGIALALTRSFLQNGAERIALLDLDFYEEMISILRGQFSDRQIFFHLTDVSDKVNLQRAFKEVMYRFKSIDCVITCAGVLDEKNFEHTINVNLVGLIHTNYIAMKYLSRESGGNGGLIVNISSVSGIDCSQCSSPVYNASKHGVVAFTRTLGDDFHYFNTGIKFIAVCPGITCTQFLDDLEDRMFSHESYANIKKKLKHVLRQNVREFAAAFIEVIKLDKNGSTWMIDGGKFKEITYSNPWHDNAI